jgi:pimeloyl-ACP methyl ester carboxylesterase
MAGELHALLSAAHVLPPYVLVAHSFGALVVRAYASRFPDQVAGLVLVDPLPESAWLHPSESQIRMLRRGITLARRGALLARLGVVRLALTLLSRGARRLPKRIAKFTSGEGESVISRLVGEVQKMPPEVWPMVQAHWCLPKSFEGLANYLESLPASSAEASALSIPDSIPVATLTAGATGAGHWIHLDRPDLVIQTIQEIVTRNSGTDESVPKR